MALDGKVTSGHTSGPEFTTGSTYPNLNILSSGLGVFKSSAKVHDSYWLLLVLYKLYISLCYCLWNRTGLHGHHISVCPRLNYTVISNGSLIPS